MLCGHRVGRISAFRALTKPTYVADVDALGIVSEHTVGDELFVEELIHGAIKTDYIVIARVTPSATALRDGVAVISLDVVAGETYAFE